MSLNKEHVVVYDKNNNKIIDTTIVNNLRGLSLTYRKDMNGNRYYKVSYETHEADVFQIIPESNISHIECFSYKKDKIS